MQQIVSKNEVDTSIFSQFMKSENAKKRRLVRLMTEFAEIMQKVIEANAQLLVSFVGRIIDKSIESNLNRCPNVEFKGAKQPNELVRYMEKIDVGLVPFEKNEFTKKQNQ